MSRVKYSNHNNDVANRIFFTFQNTDYCLYVFICVFEKQFVRRTMWVRACVYPWMHLHTILRQLARNVQ